MDQRKLDHVIQQLDRYSGPKKRLNASSTFVSCPFHSERTPSGRVFHSATSENPGYFKCYGCGQTGNWDEVAPKLGLSPYKWSKPVKQYAVPLRPADAEPDEPDLKFSSIPKGKVWRQIKTDFLISLGCKKVRVIYDGFRPGPVMLYLPVMVKGRERGFIRARLKKVDGKPSYLNKSGGWSKDYGLFLYDQAVALMHESGIKTLALVEGPRDALRLMSIGIPAIAILGTQSWSKRKSRMIELTGARRVVLCMDGDDAGLAAIELIKPLLVDLIRVRTFSLTGPDSPYWHYRSEDEPTKTMKAKGIESWDPGNMPLKKVKELKAVCGLT